MASVSTHLLLLDDIGRIVGEADSLREVMQRVVQLIAKRMNTDVCSIWLLDAGRTKLVMEAGEGLSDDAIGRATLNKGEGLTWQVVETLSPIAVEDAQADPRFHRLESLGEEPYHAYLGTPLQVRGMPIGVIYVETKEPRRFTDDEIRALSAIASQIAPVVDNARLLSLVSGTEPALRPNRRRHGVRRFVGTPCSRGVVAGTLVILDDKIPRAPDKTETVELELGRFQSACQRARRELAEMQDWLRERNAEEAALVFSVQRMMLDDRSFIGKMRAGIEAGASAHSAILSITREFVTRFESLKDVFFRERSEDVKDLAGRLVRHVRDDRRGETTSLAGSVVVLKELAPSRMVSLCAQGVAAVLTGGGGATSHAALLARSLDLPLVVGLGDFVHEASKGERVLVDAASGEVVLAPPDDLIEETLRQASAGDIGLRVAFGSGTERSGRMTFGANVSLWGDAVRSVDEDADGIGLYRTEFAFLMRPDLPSEEEQYVLYRRVVETVAPRPVTFRLLDAGGDKLVPGLRQVPEPNPLLGYRSLRLLLDHPGILNDQARALLKALQGSDGKILVPMVGCLAEFKAVRTVLTSIQRDLPPLGAMIEVPSILMEIDEVAAEADFLSIGTNDLTQHMLGVDRTNARVTRFFDACHPAMIRSFRVVAQAAHAADKPLSVCGEGASDPLLLPVWVGLGVQHLAVHNTRIRVLRTLEATLDLDECMRLVDDIGSLHTVESIRSRLLEIASPEVVEWVHARRGS